MMILKNRTRPLFMAIFIIIASSIPYLYFGEDPITNWPIYICSGFLGIGISIQANVSNSLISDVIGKDEQSSAFVYGVYGLLDKVANGIVLFFLV